MDLSLGWPTCFRLRRRRAARNLDLYVAGETSAGRNRQAAGASWRYRSGADFAADSGVAVDVFDGGHRAGAAIADKSAAFARPRQPDAVIGLGGGSNMDLAKLTAVLLTHGSASRVILSGEADWRPHPAGRVHSHNGRDWQRSVVLCSAHR